MVVGSPWDRYRFPEGWQVGTGAAVAQETVAGTMPGDVIEPPAVSRSRGGGRARWGRLAAVVAAGALMWPAFPPFGWWPLAPIGVAVFTLALRGVRARTGAWLGFCCGVVFFLLT